MVTNLLNVVSLIASTLFTCITNLLLSFELDINECSSNPCDTNAGCTDVPGSFSCTCNSGYSGDGLTCQSEY